MSYRILTAPIRRRTCVVVVGHPMREMASIFFFVGVIKLLIIWLVDKIDHRLDAAVKPGPIVR